MSEKPVHPRPRRLVDWINPAGARKVHSLIDKVYQRKNLEMAWERVKANRGSGGVDGQTLERFAEQLDKNLVQLQSELKEGVYQPRPVRQVQIPKMGKPGEFRGLGIPTIYDRVCQQALLNRMQPIFEPVCEEQWADYRSDRDTRVGRVSEYSEKAWLSRAKRTARFRFALTMYLIACTIQSSPRPTVFWCPFGSVALAAV